MCAFSIAIIENVRMLPTIKHEINILGKAIPIDDNDDDDDDDSGATKLKLGQ